MPLQDKVAVVTGGGRGIGRTVALAFAREGADVIVTARTTSEIDEVAGEVRTLGRTGLAIPVDLSQREAIQPCVREIFSHFPAVHILVNNAAIGGGQNPKLITDYDDDFWDMSVSVNLTAPYLLTKAFLPSMIAQGWGRIINISSGSGKRGAVRRAAYSATKHGLLGLTKTAALEVAEHVQPWLDSLAYRVDSSEGSVVFTGDTRPCPSVTDLAKGADLMLCMCWDDQEIMEQNGESDGQCGTTGAARMAQDAGVKKLVLVHIGPHLSGHGPMEKGIGDIRRIYDGELIFSEELMRIPF